MKRLLPILALAILAVPLLLVWLIGPRSSDSDGANSGGADTRSSRASAATALAVAQLAPAASDEPDRPAAAAPPRRAADTDTTFEARTPYESPEEIALLFGRVIVAEGQSPEGLQLGLTDKAGNENRVLTLGARGEFAFDELRAGAYFLEPSGLDDVVYAAPRRELMLQARERLELHWDLRAHCPAVVDIELFIDGLVCRGALQPLISDVPSGPLLATDPDGKLRWRALAEGPLSLCVRNYAPRGELPAVARIGKTPVLGELVRGRQQRLEARVQTALVRVLPPADESVLQPAAGVDWSADIAIAVGGGRNTTLHTTTLAPARSPLSVFRAGPGRYQLSTTGLDRTYGATLEVTAPGITVDCPLERR